MAGARAILPRCRVAGLKQSNGPQKQMNIVYIAFKQGSSLISLCTGVCELQQAGVCVQSNPRDGGRGLSV